MKAALVLLLAFSFPTALILITFAISEGQRARRFMQSGRWSSGKRSHDFGYAPDARLTGSRLQAVKQLLLEAEMDKTTWLPRKK